MSGQIGFHMVDNVLTVVLRGSPYTVHPENPSYQKIRSLVFGAPYNEDIDSENDRVTQLQNLVRPVSDRITEQLQSFGFDDISVVHGQVTVKGEPVHNSLSDRILQFMREGIPYEPLVRFMANLSENPSEESRNALFDFLEQGGFPITPDGCFLGYKGVRSDFYDAHSGKFLNMPGHTITMPREQVDNNRNNACGAGLHVGTLAYAKGFSQIVVCVKVNPRDAVSVPLYEHAKLRTCGYYVVAVYKGDEVLSKAVYDENELTAPDFHEQEMEYRSNLGLGETEEQRRTRFTAMERDQLCRLAVADGHFISLNEARFMGKDIVVETMVAGNIPLETMRRDRLAALAARRGLFSSEKNALRSGREDIIRKILDDIEDRRMLMAELDK